MIYEYLINKWTGVETIDIVELVVKAKEEKHSYATTYFRLTLRWLFIHAIIVQMHSFDLNN